MASLLEQLENNEAILLMYLADELPADDRAEVEQLLASDGGLRAELERLREANDAVTAELEHADAAVLLPVSQAVAVRRVGQAARAWEARRFARAAAPVKPKLLLPWWAYPTIAAASILLAILSWWGFQPNTTGPDLPQIAVIEPMQPPAMTPSQAEEFVERFDESLRHSEAAVEEGTELYALSATREEGGAVDGETDLPARDELQ